MHSLFKHVFHSIDETMVCHRCRFSIDYVYDGIAMKTSTGGTRRSIANKVYLSRISFHFGEVRENISMPNHSISTLYTASGILTSCEVNLISFHMILFGSLFKYIHRVILHDEHPFKYKYFLRILSFSRSGCAWKTTGIYI